MKLKFPGEEGIWPQGRKLSPCLSYLCVWLTRLPCGLWTRTLPPNPPPYKRRKAVRDRFALQGGTGDFP